MHAPTHTPEQSEEREALNASVVTAINVASEPWGLQCLRFERTTAAPAGSVMETELYDEAESRTRASNLGSESEAQVGTASLRPNSVAVRTPSHDRRAQILAALCCTRYSYIN
jgi:regulator of protease activity HflC (stomatin/prohibitin superfamily)